MKLITQTYKFDPPLTKELVLAVLKKLYRAKYRVGSLVPAALIDRGYKAGLHKMAGLMTDNLFDALDELHRKVTYQRLSNIAALALVYIELRGVNAEIALNAEFNRLMSLLDSGKEIKGLHTSEVEGLELVK